MAKLNRNDLVRLSGNETYEDLAKARAEAAPQTKLPRELPLKNISVADKVFQWRGSTQNMMEREELTLELARALQDLEEPLEALLVFPAGGRFYVVDGHHRLDAYHTAKWKLPVPIEVFQGTLDEACLQALTLNSRTKVAMSKRDKSEAAWRLVKREEIKRDAMKRDGMSNRKIADATMSKRDIAEATTVASRTVAYMRQTWRDMCEQEPDAAEDPDAISWMNALQWRSGKRPTRPEEDWKTQEAEKIVKSLLKAKIGQGLMKNPDITAKALQMLNPKLPAALITEWGFHEPEAIQEVAHRLSKGPYEF